MLSPAPDVLMARSPSSTTRIPAPLIVPFKFSPVKFDDVSSSPRKYTSLGSVVEPRLRVCPMGGLPGQPLPPVDSVGALAVATAPVRTSGQARLLWITVVAGLAASLLRKACMVVGVSEASGAMGGRPLVSAPVLWLLPWTVFCLVTVSKAPSTFASYVMPRFVWM